MRDKRVESLLLHLLPLALILLYLSEAVEQMRRFPLILVLIHGAFCFFGILAFHCY